MVLLDNLYIKMKVSMMEKDYSSLVPIVALVVGVLAVSALAVFSVTDAQAYENKQGSAQMFATVSPLTTEITLENIDDNIDFGAVTENDTKLDIHAPFTFDVSGGGYNVDTYVKGTDLTGGNVTIGVDNIERGGADPSTQLTEDWGLVEGDLKDPEGYTVSENYELNVPMDIENLNLSTDVSGTLSVIAIDNQAGDPSTW